MKAGGGCRGIICGREVRVGGWGVRVGGAVAGCAAPGSLPPAAHGREQRSRLFWRQVSMNLTAVVTLLNSSDFKRVNYFLSLKHNHSQKHFK